MIWGIIIGVVASIVIAGGFYLLGRRDGKRMVSDIIAALGEPGQKQKQVDQPVQETLQAKYPGQNFNQPMYQDLIAMASETVLTSVDSIIGKGTVFPFWSGGIHKSAGIDPRKLRFEDNWGYQDEKPEEQKEEDGEVAK